MTKLSNKKFFQQDALKLAPQILGLNIVRKMENGNSLYEKITELEVYRGIEDLACHASKGRTPRTEVMFWEGGHVYVYLIYGMYWLLNIVTGPKEHPQALLVRASQNFDGPGKLGKALNLNSSFYGEDLTTSNRIWLEGATSTPKSFITDIRVGVDYAGEWSKKPWRFILAD